MLSLRHRGLQDLVCDRPVSCVLPGHLFCGDSYICCKSSVTSNPLFKRQQSSIHFVINFLGVSLNKTCATDSSQQYYKATKNGTCLCLFGSAIKTLQKLQTHHMSHTGEKFFGCSFSQYGDLKKHQRSPTGEKGYDCSQCGKSFSWSSTLRVHKITNSGVKLYDCPLCEKSFLRSCNQKTHL